jgi:hypothetical protein
MDTRFVMIFRISAFPRRAQVAVREEFISQVLHLNADALGAGQI